MSEKSGISTSTKAKAENPAPAKTGARAPVKPGAKPSKPKAKGKGGKASPVPPPAPKKKRDQFALAGGPEPEKSIFKKEGFGVFKSEISAGANQHPNAADNRNMKRMSAYKVAHSWALSNGIKRTTIVDLFPSDYGEKFCTNFQPKGLFTLFRDRLWKSDESRALKCHIPVIPKGNDVVLVLHDCPCADLEELYKRFQGYGAGTVRLVISCLPYGGQMGVDMLKGSPATFWKRNGALTDVLAVGCNTQYSDLVQHHSWLDMRSGQLTEGIRFYHKPESRRACSFISKLLLKPGKGTPMVPLGFKLSGRGVIIDNDGLIPCLRISNWALNYGPTPGAHPCALKEADKILKNRFGNLSFLEEMSPDSRRQIDEAKIRTINYCVANPPIRLELPTELASVVASLDARERRYSDIPAGKLLASVSERTTLPDMIVRAYRALRALLIELYEDLRAWYHEQQANWRTRHGDVTELPKSEGLMPENELPALNVVASFSKLLAKTATRLSASGSLKVRKASQKIFRFASLMQKPFPSLSDISDDNVGGMLLRLLAVVGTTLLERYIAIRFGFISAAVVGVIDLIACVASEDTIRGAVVTGLAMAAGHIILAILPIWLSLPLHLLVDLVFLDTLEEVAAMFKRHGAKGTLLRLLSQIREKWNEFVEYIQSMCSNGELDLDQINPLLVDTENPAVDDWAELDELIHGLTCNGSQFDSDDMDRFILTNKVKPKYAIPLLVVPPLQNVAYTTSDFRVLLSALLYRFQNIEPAPDTVLETARTAIAEMKETMHPLKIPFTPITVEEFREHMVEKDYPKTKIQQYETRIREHEMGLPADLTVPMGGKAHELLKVKEGNVVRSRLVHLFPPAAHYPYILDAQGLKRLCAEETPHVRILSKCGKWIFRLHRPKTGTVSELIEVLKTVEIGEILICFSGDDTYHFIRTRGGKLVLASDLKSCDTTIQDKFLKAIHEYFFWIGLPQETLDCNMRMNTAPKTAKFYTTEGREEIVFTTKHAINSSGTSLTTEITDAAVRVLITTHIRLWDGNLDTYVRTFGSAADLLGLKLTNESYPTTLDNGLTPMGVCTFLSTVPIYHDGRYWAIKASYTKSLVVKFRSQADKGRGVDFGVQARAQDPSLLASPYGLAIRGALLRHSALHPFEGGVSTKTSGDQYKIQYDTHECISELGELAYIQRIVPEVTATDYFQEISSWDQIHEFPVECHPDAFPIFQALAHSHYGYLRTVEESDIDTVGQGVT